MAAKDLAGAVASQVGAIAHHGPPTPETLIGHLAAKNIAALELAVIVSIASRIEPELLRSVRRAMLAGVDASAEADLWLSPLMRTRGDLFAVMRADVTQILRARLRADAPRLHKAWQILVDVHQDLPPALRVEEEITWRALANPADPEIERLFGAVAAALGQKRLGLARWAARAMPNLPPEVRNSSAGWAISLQASALLGHTLAESAIATRESGDTTAPLSANLAKRKVGLRLFQDSLRLSQPPEPGSKIISIPSTNPLLLLIEWEDHGRNERRVVSFLPNSTQVVSPVGSTALRITTASSESFLLQTHHESPGQRTWDVLARIDGFVARAYRGDRAIMIAFDIEAASRQGLIGFAVGRAAQGGNQEGVRNLLATGSEALPPQPSDQVPIQGFRWIDSAAEIADQPITYQLRAIFGSATRALKKQLELQLEVGLPPPSQEIEIGFTNPNTMGLKTAEPDVRLRPASRQGSPDLFDTTPYGPLYSRLGGSAHRLMLDFLADCVKNLRSQVHVLAFEVDHPDIIAQFARLERRLRIVLDDSPPHEKLVRPLENRLRNAGCDVVRFHFRRFAQNNCIIQLIDGEPVSVLTGSTNFSIMSLYTMSNHVIVLRNQQVAAAYEQYFLHVFMKQKISEMPRQLDVALTEPRIQVLFAPSSRPIEALLTGIRRAKSSILFRLAEKAAPAIMEAILQQKANGLFVAGVTHGKQTSIYWDRIEKLSESLSGPFVSGGHGQFVVLDFNVEGVGVFAGSSNLAFDSTGATGDNVILMQDSNIAVEFAVEAFRTIDTYRARLASSRARPNGPQLDPTSGWLDRYFVPGTIESQERRLLIGTSVSDDLQPPGVPHARSVRPGPQSSSSKKHSARKKKVAEGRSNGAPPKKKKSSSSRRMFKKKK